MREACSLTWSALVLLFRSRASLAAEILVLRHHQPLRDARFLQRSGRRSPTPGTRIRSGQGGPGHHSGFRSVPDGHDACRQLDGRVTPFGGPPESGAHSRRATVCRNFLNDSAKWTHLPRTMMIRARIASTLHRFSDERLYLAQANLGGAPYEDTKRISLSVDQACGTNLDEVLDERRRIVTGSGQFEDRVALGALLADLGEFDDADQTCRQALRAYQDVSAFPVAWVSFQLGMLWGELVPEPQLTRAEHWYRKAIVSLPCYVRARVHLAEICLDTGRASDAETMAAGTVQRDPEASWRLADVLNAQGRSDEAAAQLEAAESGFEKLWKSTCWHSLITAPNFMLAAGG